MNYIVTKLVTENGNAAFSLLGVTQDKVRAAEIAAKAYGEYNKKASFQSVELIAEWLRTKLRHSFRRDKDHRLQLAITELDGEVQAEGKRLVFSAQAEQDELMRRVSEALWEGKHTAGRGAAPASCPIDPSDKGVETH